MVNSPFNLLRQIRPVVAAAVVLAVGFAWFLAWTTSGLTISLVPPPIPHLDAMALASFFSLMLVMMVAMMLPSALPMIVVFSGLMKNEERDSLMKGTFISAYFFVWGIFGIFALLGAEVMSTIWPGVGYSLVASPVILLSAGVYQFSHLKESCLRSCQSPLTFLMTRLKPGTVGALRTGLSHASYCLGCCWFLMLVLFFVGSMSLLWMGVLSLVIFVEKIGVGGLLPSRFTGGLLVLLGIAQGLQALAV